MTSSCLHIKTHKETSHNIHAQDSKPNIPSNLVQLRKTCTDTANILNIYLSDSCSKHISVVFIQLCVIGVPKCNQGTILNGGNALIQPSYAWPDTTNRKLERTNTPLPSLQPPGSVGRRVLLPGVFQLITRNILQAAHYTLYNSTTLIYYMYNFHMLEYCNDESSE